jgi:hypothetical protein
VVERGDDTGPIEEQVDDTGPIVMLPLPPTVRTRPPTANDGVADDEDLAFDLARLTGLGADVALPHLRSALVHPAAVVRIAAARGLAELGTSDDLPALIHQLRTSAPALARPAIVDAIGALGDATCVPVLVNLLRGQRERALHAHAAAALGRIGERSALPCLDALAAAADPAVRHAAAIAADAIRVGRSRQTYDPRARLEECLARFDLLLGLAPRGPTDPRVAMNDPIGALTELGVTLDQIVPAELAAWATWCNRPAHALRWAASRGWHFLALADALALRAALRLADSEAGPWLPIMASDFGDHQVYVPNSHREGVVYSVFSDEKLRLGGGFKSLADHASAVLDAWTTLNLATT